MPVTGVDPALRDAVLQEVDTLATSGVLKGSESLCKLLRYLAAQWTDHPGETLKEYQIATEVLGRGAHFDPRLDASVRVQTGRLRSKLAEYYALEGVEDPIVLDIPKGSYSLAVHRRSRRDVNAPQEVGVPAPAVEAVTKPAGVAAKTPAAVWVLSITCFALLAGLLYVTVQRLPQEPAADVRPVAAAPVLKSFWHGFIDQPEPPLVVFSNAEFVGRPETGMRYFNPARDARTPILDHYTGFGEVLGIHELDRVFGLLNRGIRVKRGRLLTLDDAENSDLVYVGSPSENLVLREIPTTREFVFRLAEAGPRQGDLEIVNLNPQPGEQKAFLSSQKVPISDITPLSE